jgi:DNA-binding NarL/FixJ family response regulator
MLNKSYKVVIVESDFYAGQAINSYLAWDRRTRTTKRLFNLDALAAYLSITTKAELPDTILLDGSLLPTPEYTFAAIKRIGELCNGHVLVMAQHPSSPIAHAVQEAGGRGYLIREEVALQLSWLIVWAREYPFVVTSSAADMFPDAEILPLAREYPELTDRVRQALMLCVVEGMSAELAADEMGLSPHTIRTYVKEGYSILEANDQDEYPAELSPQERAFMRFTALELGKQTRKPKKDNP